MVMLNSKLPNKWVTKYSNRPIFGLKANTLATYKWQQKIGRRAFLKHSKAKTARFEKRHPGNNHWRVFKTTFLKHENVSNELFLKLKTKIEKYNTTRGLKKYVKIMKSKESLVVK